MAVYRGTRKKRRKQIQNLNAINFFCCMQNLLKDYWPRFEMVFAAFQWHSRYRYLVIEDNVAKLINREIHIEFASIEFEESKFLKQIIFIFWKFSSFGRMFTMLQFLKMNWCLDTFAPNNIVTHITQTYQITKPVISSDSKGVCI